MNEVAKDDGRELSQAEKDAYAESLRVKRVEDQANGTGDFATTKVVPIKRDMALGARVHGIVSYPGPPRDVLKTEAEKKREAKAEKIRLVEDAVEELAQSAGAKLGSKEEPKADGAGPNFTFKDAEADPDEEAEPRSSELSSEEQRLRRLIRAMKLKEINDKYAVVRSYGGKCAVVTLGQSKGDPNKQVFEFQPKEAFDQWMANEFIDSLKTEKGKDAVAPWWFRHPKRKEYDGVIFKPLGEQVITTSGGLKILNMYLGWGVNPKQGDWSLIRQHIREVRAGLKNLNRGISGVSA